MESIITAVSTWVTSPENQQTLFLMMVGGTTVELTPAAQSRFYSVFAVDTRGNISPE